MKRIADPYGGGSSVPTVSAEGLCASLPACSRGAAWVQSGSETVGGAGDGLKDSFIHAEVLNSYTAHVQGGNVALEKCLTSRVKPMRASDSFFKQFIIFSHMSSGYFFPLKFSGN